VARAIDPGVVVAIVDRSEAAALLTRMAIEREVAVTVVPGPDPVVAAVTMSGLPSERFCYEGAPARSSPARRAAFADLAAERRTMVFLLEPGQRAEALADLVAEFGYDRPAALCQGLVRNGGQVHRAPLGELAGRWSEEDSGSEELFLVVQGASASRRLEPSPDDLVAAVADLVQTGATPKTAIAAVAQRLEVRKRVVYDAVLQAKNRG
jgi:16S rRNA (cytidine1402-2'-O)-methyltransferase